MARHVLVSSLVVACVLAIAASASASGKRHRHRHVAARHSAARVVPLGVTGRWTLRFDDEFSGSTLATSRWQPNWLGGSDTAITPPDNSDQTNCESPRQATVGGGYLHLTAIAARCTADSGRTYPDTSALVNTHATYTFTRGYIEARVRLPAPGGTCANWPSFWADGVASDGIEWPAFGELDVMECLGDGLGFHFHSLAGGPGATPRLANQGGWHTLGADLEPGTERCGGAAPDAIVATYYYDGARVGSEAACIRRTGMYLILANDISPLHGGRTVLPADMLVDYVRAWQ